MIRKKRFITTIILVHLVLIGCVLKVTAQNKLIERKQFFNSDWKFSLGDATENSQSNLDDSNWRKLNVPHDWSIEGKSEKDNPSGGDGGFYPMGKGWYRKTFKVPSEWNGYKVSIYFEGVYMNSEVFVNGQSVGVQPYGYTSFEYDLSPYLKYGEQNTIAVKVDNSQQKNCRWYSGSGIYRNVWLMVKNLVHVKTWGVAVTTLEIENNKAKVEVKTVVKNQTAFPQNVILSTAVKNVIGKKPPFSESKLALEPDEEKEITQIFTVENPKLWSIETPNLYEVKSVIKTATRILDVSKTDFGIRTINFSAVNGFLLNGKSIKLNGGCVHHDNGALGATAYDRAEERKVELLKTAGFNAVRTSHNPPSEAFLNACDRLGLLVIDESFDGWREQKNKYDYASIFDKWWKHDVESMVLRDRNHPSIIIWSIGNEIIERTKPEAFETAKMLANAIRNIDPTRPVTSAMTTWNQGWDIFDPLMAEHDVAGYNYQLHHAESDHERVPSRIIIQTESYPKDAFANWNLVQKHNYILGDFVWTAMDYLGESGIGRYIYPGEQEGEHWTANLYPWHGAYCGDVDLTGWRKPISHYRSMLYNENEKIYLAVREPNPDRGAIKLTSWAVWPTWESWTWPNQEGKNIEVEVYSKYPKVRLYLNGKNLGEKETGIAQEFKATFTIPYEKGELKAVGLLIGKETESVVLKTSGESAKIKLTADRKTIKADDQDLVYVTVEITDNKGILNPNAQNQLSFKISGGTIAGVDSADLKDADLHIANSRKAWHGRALIIIKSNKEGVINLEVTSQGLIKSSIKIQSVLKK
ncbi:sugar-binding domain-containing protein [Flavobacterium sp. 245]|uniref:sugar-binding domain-containing protein n=1 Tax=Flavobacterium sp. 245 TaxID=2512115 RepID=UPI00105D0DC6|nr:sugar-binding domain-containing protein [Flavobacterium sp. 245]TDO99104.1 beta-galactosidase [Flavobacterium sp. 245]